MRHPLLHPFTTLRSRLLAVLQAGKRFNFAIILASLLLLNVGLLLPSSALAQPIAFTMVSQPTRSSQTVFVSQSSTSSTSQLPAIVVNRLRQDVSKRTKQPLATLKIIEAVPKTWSDGCFGLAKPGELCTQALVKGWRVTVSDGKHRWLYRTDQQGRTVRLER